jgi:hypothetical protein
MDRSSFCGVATALSGKLLRPGLGTAVFGARLLIAYALPSHVFGHEAHPPVQPATAAVLDEAPFLKENDAAMTMMMNNMATTIALGTPTALAANAEGAPALRKGPWPIRNGHNYQPTEHELRALHQEDVTLDEAREIDRLYDQLLAKQ